MIPKTAQRQIRGVQHIVQLAGLAACLGLIFLEAKRSPHQARLKKRRGRAVLGNDVDDAPGRIAVQRRRGPAQNLDPLGRPKIDIIELGLSIRGGFRDAVNQHLDLTHPKSGPRAKAPNRETEVLGKVGAILGKNAGDAVERLLKADRRQPELDI